MLPSRWAKVLRDIEDSPVRTMLAVAAMTAGVFGLGMVLTAYSILKRELATTYDDTRPASAILHMDTVDDEVAASVRRLPGVSEAEPRAAVRARIRVGEDEWTPMTIVAIRDFEDLRIDTFRREEGDWPPKDDEILLERTALQVARASIGDRITIRTPEGTERTLRIAGSVHAAGLAPAWMDHVVSGFVSWGSIARPDPDSESAALRIVVDGDRLDAQHIRAVSGRIRDRLAAQGRTVTRIEIPPPGRHPHADQMDTFLFLLGAFSVLTCVLSAVLVANSIHALLIRQVRQIGMMKAVGATAAQVAAMYLAQVAILAGVSLLIGIPLGLWAGREYAAFSAGILNASLSSVSAPFWVFAVQIVAGLAVPLAAALWPVRRASRITIHEAFADDVVRRPYGTRPFDRRLARIRWLPRPLILSLRTAFHRTGRLALTVGTLAAGGAMFISSLNVSAAWSNLLEEESLAHRYDVDVRLDRPAPSARLRSLVAALPRIDRVELWSQGSALLPDGDGDGSSGERVRLVGPEEGSTILHLPVLQGRWLEAEEKDVAVVSHTLLARRPDLRVGGDLDLRVDGRPVTWRIVGVVKELIPIPMVYAPRISVSDAIRQEDGMASTLRVVTTRHDSASQLSAQKEIERALSGAGFAVADIQRLLDRRKAFEDHLVIIESALILAATLVVLVGGLALTSTLMVEIFERTREIGILGAIGATPRTISLHVMAEGVLIGLMSWLAALVTAVPVTAALDAVAGRIFHRLPLEMVYSPRAAATWLALVVVLAALSSFYPARRAAGLNVQEALAHA